MIDSSENASVSARKQHGRKIMELAQPTFQMSLTEDGSQEQNCLKLLDLREWFAIPAFSSQAVYLAANR